MSELDFMAPMLDKLADESVTVTQLNKLAKTLLENNMPIFWIKGEVSGLKTYSHAYFDLKDDSSKVSCVMFAPILASCEFKLENGQQIEVRGKITIYPANGSYQINVERIRKLGMGELWEAYHRLINKLRLEGLFEALYKKPIPELPRAIGVITSKEGSVIRDVITTLKRRTPNIPVIIYHSAVQGADAGMQITKAIQLANIRHEVDVLIICRGGGSMQDLWCFNEEVVAREVFASNIPIISAIGHETDTTIIDFVADLRAPTPTAAAELVAKSVINWQNQLAGLQLKLYNNSQYILNNKIQSVDMLYARLKLVNPAYRLNAYVSECKKYHVYLKTLMQQLRLKHQRHLDLLLTKLIARKPELVNKVNKLAYLQDNLIKQFDKKLSFYQVRLVNLISQLELLNPQNILLRGYSIVRDKSGKVITQANELVNKQRLDIVLKDGQVNVIVDKSTSIYQQELL